MTITITLLLAAVTLAILAVAMGYILGWANRAFHVEIDPKVEAINAKLPGANCGGCGFVGCEDYAEAVAEGKAAPTLCAPGGSSCAKAIANILGISLDASLPYRPVLHCAAPKSARLQRHDYVGEQTCAAANLVSGVQGCTYGCIGFGDCVRACEFDAIHMIDGVPRVDYDKCVGCKACAKACPRNVITMVPWKSDRMLVVGCSNKDSGVIVKDVCEIGCIGCSLCAKKSAGLFKMEDGLPAIDYDAYEPGTGQEAAALEKCPRESLIYVGKPSKDDQEAVADEEVPGRIRGEFETTADKTEWRG